MPKIITVGPEQNQAYLFTLSAFGNRFLVQYYIQWQLQFSKIS